MRASANESRSRSGLRPGIVAATLSVAVGLLIAAAAVSHLIHPAPTNEISTVVTQSQPALPQRIGPDRNASDAPAAPDIAPEVPKPLSTEQQIYNLDQTVAGSSPDDQKLEIVMAALENPERKVRAAALEDVLMLDNRAAIPRLKYLATRIDDADEKEALLDAADHLALPSLTEYQSEHPYTGGSNRAVSAKRSARTPGNVQNVQ